MRKYTLYCPVVVGPDRESCSSEITVHASPGHRATHWDPPEPPEIDVTHCDCDHIRDLQSGDYDDNMFDQIAEQEDSGYTYDKEND